MASHVTRGLVVGAAALGGVTAGTTLDRSVVELPAWRRVGAEPWAVYSRQADLRHGLIWYSLVGFATLSANVAAAVAVRRDPGVPRSAAVPAYVAALLAVGHMLATARAVPNLLSVRGADDPVALRGALDGFARWNAVRAGVDVVMFASTLWALASVSRS